MFANPPLPLSEACERNKGPILEVIHPWLCDRKTVFEIGSGTGQHAWFFMHHMPHLSWQMSDFGRYLELLKEHDFGDAPEPMELDVRQQDQWPKATYQAVFTANSLHIMSESSVEKLFAGIGQILAEEGILIVYGPFKYGGEYTSASNAQFDQLLQQSDPDSAIRDFEWVNQLAESQGLGLQQDTPMPANNQCIIWQK